jgi:hypothetical protein
MYNEWPEGIVQNVAEILQQSATWKNTCDNRIWNLCSHTTILWQAWDIVLTINHHYVHCLLEMLHDFSSIFDKVRAVAKGGGGGGHPLKNILSAKNIWVVLIKK